MFGFDTSRNCSSLTVADVSAAGVSFAGRYYCSVDASKVLQPSEAMVLASLGLKIVSLYEDDPTAASYFTPSRGTSDARTALQQARAARQTPGSAIYFCVDYDASADDVIGAILPYFDAVASTIGERFEVGVYGSGLVCVAVAAAGYASYTWLSNSTAWRASDGFTCRTIGQRPESTTLLPIAVDPNDAQDRCGSWRPL